MTTSRSTASLFHHFYSDHHRWLLGWLGRRLGCREQAADLAQDTFVKVLTGSEVSQIAEPRAFLTTIARRVLSNHYRRQQVERAYLEALAVMADEVSVSLEEQAEMLETLLEIDRLLDGLPPQVQQTFLLVQLDGLSYACVAEQLGISVATVKRYLVRAGERCFFATLD
ncbi:sigma-70 family RNA polymerase sigma factor [Pokkaliibacter sp. MBI-7]|uniref:sigma-70 family RNA polymerase sigma factor n=1 Tax=Pokkaliibacter sp. MBI-7 TaxID=3040600 RepID=UPI00244CF91E|nr:sigma-70 family RNA polymerase sigma factor [Pokkaliibacter sp. MBI-7]MDH2432725.1 sigma-70 family RNA polymerase sigma factor [Pokkaliibacter sp. MBI-7]